MCYFDGFQYCLENENNTTNHISGFDIKVLQYTTCLYQLPICLNQLSQNYHSYYSLQDEMFQKFNFDTEWAVRLISRITNDEDIPIEGDAIVKQVYFILAELSVLHSACVYTYTSTHNIHTHTEYFHHSLSVHPLKTTQVCRYREIRKLNSLLDCSLAI